MYRLIKESKATKTLGVPGAQKERVPSLPKLIRDAFPCDHSWIGTQRVLPDGSLSDLDCRPVLPDTVKATWRLAIREHFAGRRRLSVYPVVTRKGSRLGKTRLGIVDLDGQSDRLMDAERVMDALAQHDIQGYLARSWSDGHFHIWCFFKEWLPAGKVHRFLERLARSLGIKDAEIRPSPELSGERSQQRAIALPFFGAHGAPWAATGRGQVLDSAALAPVAPEMFLAHIEQNYAPPELPASPSTSAGRLDAALAHCKKLQSADLQERVSGWPPVSRHQVHQAPNGKTKYGRDDAAVAHAGELARLGCSEEEALGHLLRWNATNRPPLEETVIRRKVKSAYEMFRAQARREEVRRALC